MFYTVINFFMALFAIFMLEKMSRAVWSKKYPNEEISKKTSQMDREVAAGWFDVIMISNEFSFRNFTHNIPCETSDSLASSFVTTEEHFGSVVNEHEFLEFV